MSNKLSTVLYLYNLKIEYNRVMEKDREMFSIKDYKFVIKKSKITNERQAVISDFVEEINAERIGTKWKPITPRAVAIKLSHVDLDDLYAFLSMCRDYKNRKGSFSKAFFGALKPLQEK